MSNFENVCLPKTIVEENKTENVQNIIIRNNINSNNTVEKIELIDLLENSENLDNKFFNNQNNSYNKNSSVIKNKNSKNIYKKNLTRNINENLNFSKNEKYLFDSSKIKDSQKKSNFMDKDNNNNIYNLKQSVSFYSKANDFTEQIKILKENSSELNVNKKTNTDNHIKNISPSTSFNFNKDTSNEIDLENSDKKNLTQTEKIKTNIFNNSILKKNSFWNKKSKEIVNNTNNNLQNSNNSNLNISLSKILENNQEKNSSHKNLKDLNNHIHKNSLPNYKEICKILNKRRLTRSKAELKSIIKFLLNNFKFFKTFKNHDKENDPKLLACGLSLNINIYEENNIIFNCGEISETFYIILKGRVNVIKPAYKETEMSTRAFVEYLHKIKYEEKNELKLDRVQFANSLNINLNHIKRYNYDVNKFSENNFLKKYIIEEDNIICCLKEGDHFGELAISYDIRRTATIITDSKCTIAFIDRNEYNKSYIEIEQNENTAKILEFKNTYFFFRDLRRSLVYKMMDLFKIINLSIGENVYEQNSNSEEIFFSTKGTYEITTSVSLRNYKSFLEYVLSQKGSLINSMQKNSIILDSDFEKMVKNADNVYGVPSFSFNRASHTLALFNKCKNPLDIKMKEEVLRNMNNSIPVLVKTSDKPDIFGLEEALELKKRFYTIKCTSISGELYSIDLKNFFKLINKEEIPKEGFLDFIKDRKKKLIYQITRNIFLTNKSLDMKVNHDYDSIFNKMEKQTNNVQINLNNSNKIEILNEEINFNSCSILNKNKSLKKSNSSLLRSKYSSEIKNNKNMEKTNKNSNADYLVNNINNNLKKYGIQNNSNDIKNFNIVNNINKNIENNNLNLSKIKNNKKHNHINIDNINKYSNVKNNPEDLVMDKSKINIKINKKNIMKSDNLSSNESNVKINFLKCKKENNSNNSNINKSKEKKIELKKNKNNLLKEQHKIKEENLNSDLKSIPDFFKKFNSNNFSPNDNPQLINLDIDTNIIIKNLNSPKKTENIQKNKLFDSPKDNKYYSSFNKISDPELYFKKTAEINLLDDVNKEIDYNFNPNNLLLKKNSNLSNKNKKCLSSNFFKNKNRIQSSRNQKRFKTQNLKISSIKMCKSLTFTPTKEINNQFKPNQDNYDDDLNLYFSNFQNRFEKNSEEKIINKDNNQNKIKSDPVDIYIHTVDKPFFELQKFNLQKYSENIKKKSFNDLRHEIYKLTGVSFQPKESHKVFSEIQANQLLKINPFSIENLIPSEEKNQTNKKFMNKSNLDIDKTETYDLRTIDCVKNNNKILTIFDKDFSNIKIKKINNQKRPNSSNNFSRNTNKYFKIATENYNKKINNNDSINEELGKSQSLFDQQSFTNSKFINTKNGHNINNQRYIEEIIKDNKNNKENNINSIIQHRNKSFIKNSHNQSSFSSVNNNINVKSGSYKKQFSGSSFKIKETNSIFSRKKNSVGNKEYIKAYEREDISINKSYDLIKNSTEGKNINLFRRKNKISVEMQMKYFKVLKKNKQF